MGQFHQAIEAISRAWMGDEYADSDQDLDRDVVDGTTLGER
jgi:hypothetical protein